jgi:hypothetical protein
MYYAFNRTHFKPWKQITWAVLVVVAAASLLWALVAEFRDFLQHNVDTTTRAVIPPTLQFPKVILCNSNSVLDPSMSSNETEPTNEAELLELSQPLEDFMLYTQFNRNEYTTAEELKSIWTPTVTPFGLCFSFVTDEHVFFPGSVAGLRVWTWLDQKSYRPSTIWAGVHVFISTSSNVMAASQTNGEVRVPPRVASFIALEMEEIHIERDEPWSYCIS